MFSGAGGGWGCEHTAMKHAVRNPATFCSFMAATQTQAECIHYIMYFADNINQARIQGMNTQ